MVIRVLNQDYFVVQTLPSETGQLQYVCRGVAEDDGKVYRIVTIPREKAELDLIQWLSDIWRAGRFRELTQYAGENDTLQIVVDCGFASAVPMEQLLTTERLALRERVSMAGKMLERLILSDVPPFFAIPALDSEHVRFTSSMDCCFTFELEYITSYSGADLKQEFSRLRAVLQRMFRDELRDQKMPELKEMLDRMTQQEYAGMLDVWKDWLPIAERYDKADETKLEAKSWPFRVWEAFKRFVVFLKSLFFVVVILLAIIYLILSIRRFMRPTEQMDVYQSVGNMEIHQSQTAESGENAESSVTAETEGQHE